MTGLIRRNYIAMQKNGTVAGRSRCVDCRREDSKVVAESAERFPKLGTMAEELLEHARAGWVRR